MSQYNPNEIESAILDFWSRERVFRFDSKRGKNIYSIDTPPPTVSGKMHIGHAFSYSQEDFIARFRRMSGNVFYPFGTDDNGLPTERLVEKLKNVRSKAMSRSDFISLCLKTLKEITPDFIQDWKNLGISCDFEKIYSTIDDQSRKISQQSFIELFKEGLIEQKKFPTLWCTECQTSIAQAELEDKEKDSQFIYIEAEVEGGGTITYATTRPELLHACVCISVHKDDVRYKKLVGKKAKIPLSNAWVPIITDPLAKIDFGTGAVYWCPYGDKNDVAFLQRHPAFKPQPVVGKDGRLNEHAHAYKGLKIKEVRKKIIEDLQKLGVVKKIETIKHFANVHDKCGTEIEFLMTEQWFIKILHQKKKLIAQGKKINWYPDYMFKRYENWINGLEWDWSISRDRHFGIPIPVWHCDNCEKIISADIKELPIDPLQVEKKCSKCNKKARGEEKVLDTWATSSLTPQLASSRFDNAISLPYSLRPQAHDIIRTWAFYTIAKSFYHEKKSPWKNIMISGFVTLGGEKMSKSKGNVIEPQNVIKNFGADALRYWAAGSKLGEDLDYQEKDLVAGKKLLNKLWNATNFVFMNLKDYEGKKPKKFEKIDKLFLSKLNRLVQSCTDNFERFEYSKVKQDVENFFWNTFCDNYLEIVKKRVYQGTGDAKKSAQYVLHTSLSTVLKLFAPLIPFITEHIYQKYFRKTEKEKSIHLCAWPKADKKLAAGNTEIFDSFLSVLTQVRQEKSNNKKPMNAEIILKLSTKEMNLLHDVLSDLKDVANAREIKEGPSLSVSFC
ncbi:valine--tRNA ligase [Candidatus Pacearchaeota archaeon]|nr:valine--tRNA ligase [Candidatus Pacearchaeota archaeon]